MKIVLDTSTDHFYNFGDLAMLRTAVSRIKKLWPDSRIQIITSRADRLPLFCSDVEPVSAMCRDGLSMSGGNWRRMNRLLRRLRYASHHRLLALATYFRRLNLPTRYYLSQEAHRYHQALYEADLIAVPGGSWITDSFYDCSQRILQTLQLGQLFGKPTVLLGQGIGPLESPSLFSQAKQILPKVTLIGMREGQYGPALLERIGVPADRIFVTGDDAIELAYRNRAPQLGDSIGVNLRVSSYSRVGEEWIQRIQSILRNAADSLNARFTSIPISLAPGECDAASIASILPEIRQINDNGRLPMLPEDVVQRVAECRIVICGSYHAAVFALSQGIPAICLTHSDYYFHKFNGLAGQFGDGCTVVDLAHPQAMEQIRVLIRQYWKNAETFRRPLLAAAEAQIFASQDVYRRTKSII